MKMKKLTATLLSAVLGVYAMAGDALFQNGKTEWKIGISPKAAPAEQYAAQELQTALQKISGAEFPILKSETFPDGNTIIIGSPDSTPQIREKADALKLKKGNTEELAVYTLGGNLYLAGNNPRGALYAVYSFLQNQLGVRWFWPGDDGEFIRKKNSYPLPQLSFNYKPPFRFREMTPCGLHYHVPTEIWLARNFMNGGSRTLSVREKAGFYRLDGGHWVSIGKREFAKHPGYFSLIDNRRVPEGEAGCWSNPDFTKMIVQKHLDLIKKRKFDLLNTFPADITQRCECAECVKNPDPSSRWFQYYHKLIQEIRKSEPQMMFAGIAYQEYRTVPAARVEGLEYVEYCQYNRCYVHRFGDPSCGLNRKSMEELKRWQEKAPMGIYGYEFDIFAAENTVSIPFYNVIREGIRKFHSLGVQSVITEYWLGFPAKNPQERRLSVQNALGVWLYTRLLWNVNDDMDKLIAEWNSKMYGGAAREAAEITRILSENWDQLKGHISNYHNAPFGTAAAMFTPERFTKLKKLLKNGFEKKLSPQERTNFELRQSFVLQWEQAYFEGTQSNRQINIPKTPNAPYALPAFQTNNQGKAPRTDAFFSWDDKYLNITVHCYDSDMEKLRAEALKRDEQVWMDDCIEIFLSNPANTEGIYKHIAVNPRGTLYDAAAYGPGGADIHWNPEIKVKTELLPDHWKVDLKIPFASNPPVPKAGDVWRFNINRSIGNGRKGMANSGYPEASYHNPNGFAALSFSEKARVEKQVLFLVPEKFMKNTKNIGNALFRDGWNFQFCSCQKELPQNLDSYRILVVRLPQFGLQGKVDFKKLAREFLNQGKTVIFSSYEWLPLENVAESQ